MSAAEARGRLTALILTSAAALLLLAGCGRGGDGPATSAAESRATSVPQATPAPTQSQQSDARAVAEWAARFCAIAEELRQRDESIGGGIDPTTLPVDARKQRAARDIPMLRAAIEQARIRFATVQPVRSTEACQAAVVQQLVDLGDALAVQLESINRATTAADIEDANVAYFSVGERTERSVAKAAESLTPQAADALRGVNRCGYEVNG